jgi:hypothetical protein
MPTARIRARSRRSMLVGVTLTLQEQVRCVIDPETGTRSLVGAL